MSAINPYASLMPKKETLIHVTHDAQLLAWIKHVADVTGAKSVHVYEGAQNRLQLMYFLPF